MRAVANDDAAPPILPRYVRNLNALAERCGLQVSVSTGNYCNVAEPRVDPQVRIFSNWAGTKAQLFSTGLLTASQRRRLPMPSGTGLLQIPGCNTYWQRLMLDGDIEVDDDDEHINFSIDNGPAEIAVEQCGPIEVIRFRQWWKDFVSYHGSIEELIAAGISPKRLPLKKRPIKSCFGRNGPEWVSRLQPDGSCLYRVETMESWQREHGAPPVAKVTVDRLRPGHLRLVVDNTRPEPRS